MAITNPIFNLRIPPELKSQLDIRAKESGRSVTAEIIKAIESHLNNQPIGIEAEIKILKERMAEIEKKIS